VHEYEAPNDEASTTSRARTEARSKVARRVGTPHQVSNLGLRLENGAARMIDHKDWQRCGHGKQRDSANNNDLPQYRSEWID
jgi:hypothetical protein